jgi:hypothetical protein
LISALDWLARFRVVEGAPGSAVTVSDRDGTVSTGAPAIARVLSRLPVTAWFALPALLLPAVRRALRSQNPGRAGQARDSDGADQPGLAASGPD